MSTTVAFIFAHPDDETFSSSCLIREIVARGGNPVLLSATRGDAGKTGLLAPMSKQELAVIREQELKTACEILGMTTIEHLGYPDGQVSQVPREELVQHIEKFIEVHQADIVITFPADGVSGHADHIAVHHAVNEAIMNGHCPSVKKLYYCTPVLPEDRHKVTIMHDITPHWEWKARALQAHESQIFSVQRVFPNLPEMPSLGAMRTEAFTLVWENGKLSEGKQEDFIF
ncbi:PIG-L deacetylase family protein [Paenibacillus marinisediminis]